MNFVDPHLLPANPANRCTQAYTRACTNEHTEKVHEHILKLMEHARILEFH